MSFVDHLRDRPRRILLVLGYALVVFVASVMPTPGGSLTPAGPLSLVGLDKWLHGVGYAGLGFGLALATGARRPDEIRTAVVVTGLYGAGIELVQALLPYRTFSVADMGANVFGAVLGGLLWYAAVRLRDWG